MHCEEARTLLSELERGEACPAGVTAHLETCLPCREEAARMTEVDRILGLALAASAPPPPALPSPRAFTFRWRAAAAAVLLLAAAWGLASRTAGPAPAAPRAPAPAPLPFLGRLGPGAGADLEGLGRLEVAPGGLAEVLPGADGAPPGLSLLAGACWLEAPASSEARLLSPLSARITPGSRLEIRLIPPPSSASAAAFLCPKALAEEGATVLLSVLSGEVETAGGRIPAGRRGRLGPGASLSLLPLSEADVASIEGWRARRIQGRASWRYGPAESASLAGKRGRLTGDGAVLEASARDAALIRLPAGPGPEVFSAELGKVNGYIVLRYPVPGGEQETLLGALSAWKAEGWQQLSVRTAPWGVEVFLDGRILLRTAAAPPPEAGEGVWIGIRGGSMTLRSLAGGSDAP